VLDLMTRPVDDVRRLVAEGCPLLA